jgi:hypothetical protein
VYIKPLPCVEYFEIMAVHFCLNPGPNTIFYQVVHLVTFHLCRYYEGVFLQVAGLQKRFSTQMQSFALPICLHMNFPHQADLWFSLDLGKTFKGDS